MNLRIDPDVKVADLHRGLQAAGLFIRQHRQGTRTLESCSHETGIRYAGAWRCRSCGRVLDIPELT